MRDVVVRITLYLCFLLVSAIVLLFFDLNNVITLHKENTNVYQEEYVPTTTSLSLVMVG